jgi:hypothetical protein
MDQGIKPTYHFIIGPLVEFMRRFIYMGGVKEGFDGLILSTIFSYYIFIMYVRLLRFWIARVKLSSKSYGGMF